MKIKIVLLLAVLPMAQYLKAQDIWVKRFEVNNTSIIARTNQVKDKTGEACAVLRCYVRGNDYSIDKTEVLKDTLLDGEIRLWVPKGTKKLTIRNKNLKPLIGYRIPVKLEKLTDYDVDIESISETNTQDVNANEGNRPMVKSHLVYIGAGYNVLSISGPSVAIGVNLNHHNIELGAVYGLNKTDDLYYYDQSGSAIAGYKFNAIRAYLKYGYEIPLSEYFSLSPQAGIAYHTYSGESVLNSNDNSYNSASSMSLLAGLRFTLWITNNFKFCLTPEYDMAVYKGDNCNVISSIDDTLKSWHTGLNLNVGIMVYF